MSSSSSASKRASYSISSSSLLDLKAELSKREDAHKKEKDTGQPPSFKPKKKIAKIGSNSFSKSNKGIKSRKERDKISNEVTSAQSSSVQSSAEPSIAMNALRAKALLYDKIRKGKQTALNNGHIESLLVDFDRKTWEGPQDSEDSNDEDEEDMGSLPTDHIAEPSDKEEPLVEWIDDFGRTRMSLRNALPPPIAAKLAEEHKDFNVYYGDQTSFPVYVPDSETIAARAAAREAASPLDIHYDASTENRARGAAFYSFSKNEAVRKSELLALQQRRKTTEEARLHTSEADKVAVERSQELLERRRILEEKKRELRQKRSIASAANNADPRVEKNRQY